MGAVASRWRDATSSGIDGSIEEAKDVGIVRLNVGGRVYISAASTLQSMPDSMLSTLLASHIPSATVNGAYFIDRDADLFAYVLEYLRTRTVELPHDTETLRRLDREADFFMLPDLQHLVRSKLFEVCLEVKLYAEPFGCSEDECNCGDGGPDLGAFSIDELDAMDAQLSDYKDHPVKERRPCFKSPFATVDVTLKRELPRSPAEARVVVTHTGFSGLNFTPERVAAFTRCNGDFKADGVFNGYTKYKNEMGAIVYFKNGHWMVNSTDDVNAHLFSVASDANTPPTGGWSNEDRDLCIVEGEDHPRADKDSVEIAVKNIRGAMLGFEGPLGLIHIDKLLEHIGVDHVLEQFVEEPDVSHREFHAKIGPYNVGDRYFRKQQRRHFKYCLKLAFDAQSASQCKRRRIDRSIV